MPVHSLSSRCLMCSVISIKFICVDVMRKVKVIYRFESFILEWFNISGFFNWWNRAHNIKPHDAHQTRGDFSLSVLSLKSLSIYNDYIGASWADWLLKATNLWSLLLITFKGDVQTSICEVIFHFCCIADVFSKNHLLFRPPIGLSAGSIWGIGEILLYIVT